MWSGMTLPRIEAQALLAGDSRIVGSLDRKRLGADFLSGAESRSEAFAMSILVVILGAIFLVHLPHGFDINKGGIEYPLIQLLIALALLFADAGRYSLAGSLPPSLRKL
jgi:hypothetical protein